MNQNDIENYIKLMVFAMGIDGNIDRRESELLDVISEAIGKAIPFDVNPVLQYMSRLTDPEKAYHELTTVLNELSHLTLKEKQGLAKHVIHMVGADMKVNDNETDLLLDIEKAWGIDIRSLV